MAESLYRVWDVDKQGFIGRDATLDEANTLAEAERARGRRIWIEPEPRAADS